MEGIVGGLDTAYTAFTAAQAIINFNQNSNNYTQQTEISTLQGQIDSHTTRFETIEEQLGISFGHHSDKLVALGSTCFYNRPTPQFIIN